MAHNHAHSTAAGAERGRLVVVLGITLAIMGAEVGGGLAAHSLVLLADAGHLAADSAGIGLSLLAIWFSRRPSTAARTFGYQRAEILGAVANAVVLLVVGVAILVEAIRRLAHPAPTTSGLLVVFGALALAGNGASVALLRRGEGRSINVRGAFLEVLSDLLGAVAILVVAAVIAATGFVRADPLASILIAVLIGPRAVRLLGEAVDVLLEATPRGIDLAEIRTHILDNPGVLDVHDLHVWTITSGVPVISVHVVVDDAVLADGVGGPMLDRLAECLTEHFDVEHCTFQLEPASHLDHERAMHP